MRVLLAMVEKDLRRRLRSPIPTLVMLLFPILFASLIALTFGGGAQNQAPKVRLLLDDRDDGLVGRLVTAAFEQGEAREHFEVTRISKDAESPSSAEKTANPAPDDASRLEAAEASALLRLPEGFSDAFFAGRPAEIELVLSPAQSILPEVAREVTAVIAEGLSTASRLLRQPFDEIRRTPVPQGGGVSDVRVAEISVLFNGVINRSRRYLLPPVVKLETASAPQAASASSKSKPKPSGGPNPIFLLFLPGVSVYALFNLADQSQRDLLVEARLKTLRRQLAGPFTPGRVLAGKALTTAVVSALALLVLTAVGAVVAPSGVSLAGYLLLSLALVVAATGFASAVFGAARGERQGATLANLLSIAMALTGGSFIPLDSLPASVRAVSPFSLLYWATRGFQRLVNEGAGLREVLPEAAVLGVAGLVLFGLSIPLWRRRLLAGDLA
ncbi:MAG TPA: ABC transporter permease [Thermoanaerobaculia bacterium]|nr:ABC transporter permease [Thermoanaerobaculia bacterium]